MALNISFNDVTIGFNDTTTNLYNSEFCSSWPRSLFETVDSSVPYIVNAALNAALSITTTFANILVLLAMPRITSIRLPSKLLLCSLVLTDLGAGLVVQPQLVAFYLRKTNQYSPSVLCLLARLIHFLGWLFGGVSLLTMTAISLDRYIALFYHLRYQQIVTTRRVSAVLIFIWLFSVFVTSTGLLWVWAVRSTIVTISYAVCLLVMSVAYIKINWALRRQNGQVQAETHAEQQGGNTLNIAKYKRIASAMLWVYVLFIMCFVPFFCVYLIIAVFEDSARTVCIWEFFYTVVLLNSCLNPFVYCVRLPNIRAEVLKKLRKFNFLSKF